MKQSPANALLWIARVAWVALAVVPNALDDTSAVFVGAAWVVWALGVLAVVWQSPLSLTVIRVLTPLAVVGLVGSLVFSDSLDDASVTDVVWPLVGIALSIAVIVASFLPYYAAAHVQAAAYGSEQRFPLRVPVPLVAPMVVAWAVSIGLLIALLFALAGRVWWLAAVLGLLTAAVGKVVLERMHRFSRRWLVVVPAGVVVHDHLLLAETFMAKSTSVASVSIAAGPGDALDLTAVARGSVIVVHLRDTDDVILSPYLAKLLGIAYAVAPTLAAQALAALTRPPATT